MTEDLKSNTLHKINGKMDTSAKFAKMRVDILVGIWSLSTSPAYYNITISM